MYLLSWLGNLGCRSLPTAQPTTDGGFRYRYRPSVYALLVSGPLMIMRTRSPATPHCKSWTPVSPIPLTGPPDLRSSIGRARRGESGAMPSSRLQGQEKFNVIVLCVMRGDVLNCMETNAKLQRANGDVTYLPRSRRPSFSRSSCEAHIRIWDRVYSVGEFLGGSLMVRYEVGLIRNS